MHWSDAGDLVKRKYFKIPEKWKKLQSAENKVKSANNNNFLLKGGFLDP